MTIEKFLLFWDSYNVHIIEALLAIIVIVSLLQAYRLFLGKKSDHDDGVGGSSLDAAQIEKTLQKILDAQKQGAPTSGAAGKESSRTDEMSANIDISKMDGGGAEAVAAAEARAAAQISQLQQQVEEQKKQVTQLQEQLQAAPAAGTGAAPTGGGDGGASAAELSAARAEKDALADKIKDLEARLAEYEIISEDIADLSKFREENDALKSEIANLKAEGAAAPAAAAPQAAAEPVLPPQPVVEAAPEEPAPVAAAEPAVEEAISPVAAAEAAAMAADQATVDTGASADLIDDELMKEFAAAVEGQKNLSQAADKATTAEEKKPQGDETEKLMGEFENFVNKKS